MWFVTMKVVNPLPGSHRRAAVDAVNGDLHRYAAHSVMAIFYRILAPQVWSQEEWYRILDKGRSCGVHKDMQRRSSSLCNSQCHGYLLSKRTIGRVSAQVESDSPSCILHYDIVMSSTKAMLCNLRLQT